MPDDISADQPRLPTDYFDRPSPARMWNYLQGGKDNYKLDRQAGDAMAASYAQIFELAKQSRQFLIRAVRHVATEAGVRQFLDLGCGMPAPVPGTNTHEIAQEIHPGARVVYTDSDPVVLTHAEALLRSRTPEGRCAYIEADVRDIDGILERSGETLDFGAPVGVVMFGILGAVPASEAHRVLSRVTHRIASGSYLLVEDGADCGSAEQDALANRHESGVDQYSLRTPAEIARYFDGLELVEPGLVPITAWRPEPTETGAPEPLSAYGGVARKP